MLIRLSVQNFALAEKALLEFSPELNVLTGETGAGKSVLIDAIRFVLGERMEASRVLVSGSPGPASVEAVFELPSKKLRSHPSVADFLSPEDEFLILRREVQADSKSRAWVNSRAVNQSALKEIGRLLVDIHGQYDHQRLLDPATHLEILDLLAGNGNLLEEYGKLYREYSGLLARRREIELEETGREREMDLLKYQINEITRAGIDGLDEEELAAEYSRLANAEKLKEFSESALLSLNDAEDSASNLFSKAGRELSSLVRFDPSLEGLKKDCEEAHYALEEIIRRLQDYQESLTFDPERFAEIEKQRDCLELLKRKYGGSIEAVREFFDEARKSYERLANGAVYIKDIGAKLKSMTPELEKLAGVLSEKRKKTGGMLKRTIEEELRDLNIPEACFECRSEAGDFGPSGRDRLEFFISLNPGHPPQELGEIISGGEASRVMLAIKKALIAVDPVPVLIFDEIDANIGGRLGTVTGRKLKEIAGKRQVLLVTHLPQIASFADRHFKVKKALRQGRAFTEYKGIEGDERVRELAQMMSGQKETDIARRHAEEMLTRSRP